MDDDSVYVRDDCEGLLVVDWWYVVCLCDGLYECDNVVLWDLNNYIDFWNFNNLYCFYFIFSN